MTPTLRAEMMMALAAPPPWPEAAPEKDARAAVLADLLATKMIAGEGGAERAGWGSAQTPCAYANAAREPAMLLGGLIKLSPRSVAVHPGPDRDVAIGWRSPMAGTVSVEARVTH
jgi:hypothetical protein